MRLKTESGQYALEWRVNSSFFDIDENGTVREFMTDPMSGASRHRCSDNGVIAEVPTAWWEANVVHLTPFTTWQVAMPQSFGETNRGLTVSTVQTAVKQQDCKALGHVLTGHGSDPQITVPIEVPAETVDITLSFTVEARPVRRNR